MFEDGREIQELADVKRPSPSLRPVFGLSGNTLQIHQNHIEYVRKKRPNRHWAWNHWLKYKLYSIYLSTSIKMFVCVYIYIYMYIHTMPPTVIWNHPPSFIIHAQWQRNGASMRFRCSKCRARGHNFAPAVGGSHEEASNPRVNGRSSEWDFHDHTWRRHRKKNNNNKSQVGM